MLAALPETLKNLTIFEDFNEDYNIVFGIYRRTQGWMRTPDDIRTPSPAVGVALAWRSTRLEKLSASYIVDALDFFKAREPYWIWNDLKSLTLTSPLLTPRSSSETVNQLLAEAGAAALQMPSLETLELWNGIRWNAGAFRYRVVTKSRHFTTITLGWCGTFDLILKPDVLDSWKEVAALHSGHELVVLPHESLVKETITSHAAAIRALQLNEGVIHSESLDQITRESHRYFQFRK